MKKEAEFVRRLEEIYEGEPWFGESILTKLKDVSPEKAFQQPKSGEHCIAELLSHMEFWRRSILYKIMGDASTTFSTEHPDNWPDVESLKKKGWEKVQQGFRETHRALQQALVETSLTDEQSANLSGTIEHDIYHLGQIGIVKKLVVVRHLEGV